MGTGVPISTYPMEPVGAFGCKGPECPTDQGDGTLLPFRLESAKTTS